MGFPFDVPCMCMCKSACVCVSALLLLPSVVDGATDTIEKLGFSDNVTLSDMHPKHAVIISQHLHYDC